MCNSLIEAEGKRCRGPQRASDHGPALRRCHRRSGSDDHEGERTPFDARRSPHPRRRRRSGRDRPAGSPDGWRRRPARCSDCARDGRGRSGKRAWRARRSRRTAAASASGGGSPRPTHRRSSRVMSHARSVTTTPGIGSPATRSIQRGGSSVRVARADDGHPGHSSRSALSPSRRPGCRTPLRTGSGPPWPRSGC